jgi:hypothetical protein
VYDLVKQNKYVKIMKKISLLSFSFVLVLSHFAFCQIKIPYLEAVRHVGEQAIVFGKVDEVLYAKNGNIFINFGGEYPYNDFTGLILKEDTQKFENLKNLQGKEVEIIGMIKEFNSMAEIVISDTSQIKITGNE